MQPANFIAETPVGIAEFRVTNSPGRLIALGLGSCVAVSLYDPVAKIGGLLHVMLPDSTQFNHNSVKKPSKFADLGVPLLVSEIKGSGGKSSLLQAKIAGGAQMFSGSDSGFVMNIGLRNVGMVRTILQKLGIKLIAEDTGGNRGRTIILDTSNGSVYVRYAGLPAKVI